MTDCELLVPLCREAPRWPADWIVPKCLCPVAQGRRGDVGTDVHLLCRAGDYELDVLVRDRAAGPCLEIVGQVTLSQHVFEPAPGLPLALVLAASSEAVHETRTNRFGEFDFGPSRGSAYGVRIGHGPEAPCVLVWEGPPA